MKILWIVNMLMPGIAEHLGARTGASGTWMIDIADRLSQDPEIELAIACVYGTEFQRIDLEGTRFYMLPGNGKNMLFYTRQYEQLWRRVYDDFAPDIVHLHGTEYSHGLSFLRRHTQVKAVVSIQGMLTRIKDVDLGGLTKVEALRYRSFRENMHLNGMLELHALNRRNAKYETEILQRVQYANCVNTWDSSLARSINPRLRCFMLEYNLRDEFYTAAKWSIDDAERHSIFTNPGGIPLKGLHMLIRALAIVRRNYPDAKLMVPGMGDEQHRLVTGSGYSRYIRDLVEKLCLSDAIEFLGRQSGDEMMSRMRRAHVVVVPSAIEGTSLVLREAMFLGVPCIASFRGGMADFISDKRDGFLYDYQEYPYLATRIMQLFADDDLCSEFSKAAVAKAEAAHDREANISAYVRMYEEIMSGTRSVAASEHAG